MKRIILFCCIATVLIGWSCTNDPPSPGPEPRPTLPPITQTGQNTFGCRVNGEVWLPQGDWQNPSPTVDYYNNCVLISAERIGQNPYTYLHLDFGKVFNDTSFVIQNYLDSAEYQYFVYNASYYPSGPITSYYPVNPNSGELNLLKLDTVNRIVSGTFHFVGIDTLSGDTVRIEDGRFDIQY